MRLSKYLAIIIGILFFNNTYAQLYIVTSNADSGPGTLREGLTRAIDPNRTTPYIINFNLPGTPSDNANRTIRLRTALPIVSSNVVIDGTSQTAWPALGVSGAKVILEPEYTTTTFSGLVIGQSATTQTQTTGVEIYGLNIRNFATITNLQNVNMGQGSGIVIDYRSTNIIIGAAGKGNVIGGNINGIVIQNSYFYTNTIAPIKIKIQSNLIGVIYDGITPNTNVIGISANLYDCALDVGGDNAGEGNVVAANKINIDVTRASYSTPARFDVNIINNKIGVDYTGRKDFHELPIFLSSSSLEISGLKVNSINTALYVRNNIIGGNRTTGVSITTSDFILTGNAIGTDATGTIVMGNGIGVKVEANATGNIGGATAAEANIIANNNFGIETVSARPVKITRNSMFCNKTFGIGKTLSIFQPIIQILKKNATGVYGKATPNSEVELFYTVNCSGICEGKTYIATVQAGSDGRWSYPTPVTGMVTATASLLNATTSPFSTAELLPNEAIVEPVTCSANGSITIPEVREGFTFSWVKIETDGSRVPKGNTQSISGLDVGTYEVTIDDGCKAFPSVFVIKDQKLTKPTIIAPVPTCGQTSFTFTAEVLRGKGVLKFKWINSATSATVSNSNPAVLPEGNYFVTVTDEANCSLDSDPIDIKRKPQPKIRSPTKTTPAACGKDNGGISGMVISDATGTLSYKWFKRDATTGILGTDVVSTTLDLENVGGGGYTLYVYDLGQCSPVTQSYNISTYSDVSITGGTVTLARCGLNNGAIDLVNITNADTYEWLGPTGQSIKKGTYSPGMSIKIMDLAPGTYTLRASNSLYICSLDRTFRVDASTPTVFAYTQEVQPTTCELINGSITLNFSSVLPTVYSWVDESGNTIPSTRSGNVISLKSLPGGNYRMLARDIYDCPQVLGPFALNITPKLNIVSSTGKASKDGCSLQRGSVTGVQVIGGIPAYDFKWINATGEAIQYTQDLINVGAGTYRLEVRDKTACGYAISEPFTIIDEPFKIVAPIINDLRVCYVSDITLPVTAPEEGIYQLFEDMEDSKPFLESKNGVFNFKVAKTADYYVRRTLGSCMSEFTKVHVEVTHDNLEVTNTMTPNGDGMNDIWQVRGLPDFKGTNIKIYTRGGQLVYESIGNYTKPFDGRFRDKELPAGVYYYVIDLRAECKPLGGSITLLR
ncbi:gliding motility-associated C-terminal domain-containing protein [Pedobacter frigidisoli]|uniref:Gliding motility-associated C-terminal domain-containing protein n=1 Tax=Pedobacter frigidisoli TaxID=2530455 RepID=A0A4V2MNG0_9SPHI|nr:gliding motility-associated C-terminal domain-containing protein [Pedobacter frigidisoli]TCD12716.1 gliding motility-associated C-terminal domain-containing protein [Pedobacter frigidisoli]